jgi:hypothetical protein
MQREKVWYTQHRSCASVCGIHLGELWKNTKIYNSSRMVSLQDEI